MSIDHVDQLMSQIDEKSMDFTSDREVASSIPECDSDDDFEPWAKRPKCAFVCHNFSL